MTIILLNKTNQIIKMARPETLEKVAAAINQYAKDNDLPSNIGYDENLAETYHKHNYQNVFGKKRPSLIQMKNLYDIAISKNPDLSKILEEENLTQEELKEYRYRANIRAVNELINM